MASRTGHSRRIVPPAWETNRPFLTGSALRDTAVLQGTLQGGPNLAPFPPSTQEKLAIEDALYALMGVNTQFMEHYVNQEGLIIFNVETSRLQDTDIHIVPLLSKVLVLANDYNIIREFVEETRVAVSAGGFVRQALGVAISELLSEYRGFICRLEEEHRTNDLSLQKLVYLIQPSGRSMVLLRTIVESVVNPRGGAALDKVYKLTASYVGSEERHDMLSFIVQRVSEPILNMLDTWVLQGTIDDPFEEFFVKEDTGYRSGGLSQRDAKDSRFWAGRYKINTENLPDFVAPFIQKILRAGQYLNVLKECGINVAPTVSKLMAEERLNHAGSSVLPLLQPDEADGMTHMRLTGSELLSPDAGRRIAVLVNLYFAVASKALMTHLRTKVKLVERLRSLRRYFLLEQGDFLVHFFDSAHHELRKERSKVSKNRLATLLELSVRTSVSAVDPYHEELTCRLHSDDIATQVSAISGEVKMDLEGKRKSTYADRTVKILTGYDVFSFDYSLKWPMKLIVSDIEMLKYQLISRYLLHLKRVEYELERCWVDHSVIKDELSGLRNDFVRSFALRNRMLQFVRYIMYYTLVDVLEPNWRKLSRQIAQAKTLDEIIMFHGAFLDSSLRESLVSNDKHLKELYSITQVCILFAMYTAKTIGDLCKSLQQHTTNTRKNRVSFFDTEKAKEELTRKKFKATISKMETKFDSNLRNLMDGLSAMSKKRASAHLANLVDVLDVSKYYQNQARLESAAYGVASTYSVGSL